MVLIEKFRNDNNYRKGEHEEYFIYLIIIFLFVMLVIYITFKYSPNFEVTVKNIFDYRLKLNSFT